MQSENKAFVAHHEAVIRGIDEKIKALIAKQKALAERLSAETSRRVQQSRSVAFADLPSEQEVGRGAGAGAGAADEEESPAAGTITGKLQLAMPFNLCVHERCQQKKLALWILKKKQGTLPMTKTRVKGCIYNKMRRPSI